MKYKLVQLSTSHTGGAGIAARNLSSALNSKGFSSTFLSIGSNDYIQGENELSVARGTFTRILSGLNAKFQQSVSNKTYFSLMSVSVVKFRDIEALGGPHELILHIHNWFNMLNVKTMQKLAKNKYNFVFTLHDMRMITGGCHYSLECKNFNDACKRCPKIPYFLSVLTRRNHRNQKRFLEKYSSQIRVVAPSKWLTTIASNQFSPLGISVSYVPNYHPDLSKNSSAPLENRKKGGRLSLGVASLDPNSYLKGGDLIPAIKGELLKNCVPVDFLYLRDFGSSSKGLSDFYSRIDYLLVLSRADNSPNVIHEARNYGVKIIGTRVGGISELLVQDFDIPVDLEDLNVSYLVNTIGDLASSDPSPHRSRVPELSVFS